MCVCVCFCPLEHHMQPRFSPTIGDTFHHIHTDPFRKQRSLQTTRQGVLISACVRFFSMRATFSSPPREAAPLHCAHTKGCLHAIVVVERIWFLNLNLDEEGTHSLSVLLFYFCAKLGLHVQR